MQNHHINNINYNLNHINENKDNYELIDIITFEKSINICYIGAGYVGGISGAVMAYMCPEDKIKVTICDACKEKIYAWNSDKLPIYEPGLDDIVKKSRGINLFFTIDIENTIKNADIIFIAVETPTKDYGFGLGEAAELSHIENAVHAISKFSNGSKIIVEKSTVPCKTAEYIRTILNSNKIKCYENEKEYEFISLSPSNSNSTLNDEALYSDTDSENAINNSIYFEVISNSVHSDSLIENSIHFEILSNPEFLSEGNAVYDVLYPDRILIGGNENLESKNAQNLLKKIYSFWVPKEKIILMNLWSAELSKLASNALLAQRISSINALSLLCEKIGADIQEISYSCGLDTRIGPKFINPSIGFGGCFKKDVLNLVYLCNSFHLTEVAEYWKQVIKMNEYRKEKFIKNIFNSLFNTLLGKRICVFGFAFKKNTKDTRESPAVTVVRSLLKEGAKVYIYDPQVPEQQIIEDIKYCENYEFCGYSKNIRICKTPYKASIKSDAIVICTEWDEFCTFDYQKIYNNMRKPSYIFDGRLILDHKKLKNIGFIVEAIGKILN